MEEKKERVSESSTFTYFTNRKLPSGCASGRE